jgi:hypothetical protein
MEKRAVVNTEKEKTAHKEVKKNLEDKKTPKPNTKQIEPEKK